MGKQIGLFLSKTDELVFLKKINEYKSIIIDDITTIVTAEEANESNELSLFFMLDNSIIIKNGDFIDQIKSEIIQFSRCKSWNDGFLSSGRIWTEMKYWDSNDKLVTKSSELNQLYNIIAKWVKKNMHPSTCRHYYIGDQAYEFYKNSNWKMVAGPKHFVEFELQR